MTAFNLPRPARVGLCDFVLPAVCGVVAMLGFAPFGYYGLTWLALVGLLGLWWSATARRGAWRGFVFGLGLFGAGLHWPFVSVYHYGNAPLPLAIVLVCLLVIYLSLYPALAGALAGATRRLPRPLWALVFVPAGWLLAELLRGWVMTGFPWLSLGYTLTTAPVAGLVPLGGVFFVGALMMASAGVVVLLLAGSTAARALSVILIAATPIALWFVPPAITWTHPRGEPVSFAIVQGNFPQDVKWSRAYFGPTLRRYQRLTAASDADVVVWPEVAVPAIARQVRPYLEAIDELARRQDQAVLVGTLTQQSGTGRYYNSVLALGSGQGHYYKHHLVPFGEYFPLPDFVKQWMDAIDMRYSSFARGSVQQPPIKADSARLGVSICFEDAFGAEIAQALPQAGILVNVTNDAWFAGTLAAAQHFNISRMRALETGRPLVRAANTGISAFIGPTGRVIKRTDQFEVAVLNARVQPRGGMTPYARYGNVPLWWAGWLLSIMGVGWAWYRRRKT